VGFRKTEQKKKARRHSGREKYAGVPEGGGGNMGNPTIGSSEKDKRKVAAPANEKVQRGRGDRAGEERESKNAEKT